MPGVGYCNSYSFSTSKARPTRASSEHRSLLAEPSIFSRVDEKVGVGERVRFEVRSGHPHPGQRSFASRVETSMSTTRFVK